MNNIISVKNLGKSYGKIDAVKNISFTVESGKLFAFLGPNGAGKSTTIDIISTLLKQDSGQITIKENIVGVDDENIRKLIGVVFQDSLLDNYLTVRENLTVRGSFYNLAKKDLILAIKKAAEVCGITDILDRPYGKLSGGQKRRSDIARAIINTPEILFLDEPTTGLDPQTRSNIWKSIKEMQITKGMTVFLTTHYMEEAADADYVIIIDNGEIAAMGTPSQLRDKYSNDRIVLTAKDVDFLKKRLDSDGLVYDVLADNIYINLDSAFDAIPILEKYQEELSSFEVLKGTMDDAFIKITGKEIRE
ncbi:MAG: ABC transporter ATP-binding protein [Firmicutes bacterium]|nr:ABC transporter ATP-binding protein [Bacillota bacterium]